MKHAVTDTPHMFRLLILMVKKAVSLHMLKIVTLKPKTTYISHSQMITILHKAPSTPQPREIEREISERKREREIERDREIRYQRSPQ